jgi:hypothetical protein
MGLRQYNEYFFKESKAASIKLAQKISKRQGSKKIKRSNQHSRADSFSKALRGSFLVSFKHATRKKSLQNQRGLF